MDTIIIIVLVVCIIIIIGVAFWINGFQPLLQPTPSPPRIPPEFKIVRDAFQSDASLHRLLMIEIINSDSTKAKETITSMIIDPASTLMTFQKIKDTISIIEQSIVRFLGGTTSRTIGELLINRAEIIRNYYRSIKDIRCNGSGCLDNITSQSIHRDLSIITDNIIDAITQSSHLIKTSTRLDRLLNLMNIYDQELINQARSYAANEHEISLRCSNSITEIATNLGLEFNYLMKESHDVLQIPA